MATIRHVRIPKTLFDGVEREWRIAARCKLPFRLRIPELVHLSRPGTQQHAYLLNRLAISDKVSYRRPYATGAAVDEERVLRSRVQSTPNDFCTDVLLVSKPQPLRISTPPGTDAAYQLELPALTRLLNGVLVSYCTVTNDRSGIFPYRLYQATELVERVDLVFHITLQKGTGVSLADAREMLDERGDPLRPIVHHVGRDLPLETLSRDLVRAFELHEREVFYQFEIEASLSPTDPARRLLLGCIALEACHASLLRSRIAKRDALLDTEIAVSEFLMGGFMRTVVVTPALVMEPDERPPKEAVDAALEGIKARNDIMHALRKRGEYKFAKHDRAKFTKFGDDVLTLLQYFKRAIEADWTSSAKDLARPIPDKTPDGTALTGKV